MDVTRMELSDKAQRQRRNLVFSAFLIIILRGFGLQISKADYLGLSIDGLTIDVVIYALLSLMVYSTVAFILSYNDEYRHWELNVSQDHQARMITSRESLDLLQQIENNKRELQGINKNLLKMKLTSTNGHIEKDYASILDLAKNAKAYVDGLNNFDKAMKIRLFAWDLGIALLLFVIALFFVFLPSLTGFFLSLPSLSA